MYGTKFWCLLCHAQLGLGNKMSWLVTTNSNSSLNILLLSDSFVLAPPKLHD